MIPSERRMVNLTREMRMKAGDLTGVASIHSRSRPEYPATLVDRIVRRSGILPGDEVVEIGAGTAIFSRERCLDLWPGHRRLQLAAGPAHPEVVEAIARLPEERGVSEVAVPFACRAWTLTRGQP